MGQLRRSHYTVLGLVALMALTALSGGCKRPSNATSQKGPGGLPMQNFDSSQNVIAWDVPEELKYPNMTQLYDENNRIYLVGADVKTVAEWYMGVLENAQRQDINGTRHVKIYNETMEVDIESGGDQTKIVLNPLDLGGRKKKK